MNNYKISNLSFSFIVLCLINSSLLGMVFPYLVRTSNNSILYSLGISFILGFIILFVFLKLFNYEPDKTLTEKINYFFPKPIAIVINIIIDLLFFLMVIIIFWRFSTFISSEYLTETPSYLITLLLASPILLAMLKDFDIAARCATIIIIGVLILLIFSRTTLFTYIKIDNFKPIIFNLKDSVKGSGVLTILQLMPLFTALNIPKNKIINNTKTTRSLIFTYMFSFSIISSMIITIVGVMGINTASLYSYPSYVVLKNISLLNFINNIENFSVIFWIMFMSFTCAFTLYSIKVSISKTFNINSNKVLNIIILILFSIFIGLILFMIPYENFINKFKDAYVIIPFYIYSLLFVIFILISLFSKLKPRC